MKFKPLKFLAIQYSSSSAYSPKPFFFFFLDQALKFSKEIVETIVYPKGSLVATKNKYLTIACPEGTFDQEAKMRIYEITAGPFIFPMGYHAASFAYLVELDTKLPLQKEIAIQMRHSANEKDFPSLKFMSTSKQRESKDSTYVFKPIEDGIFDMCDYGKIGLKSLDSFVIIVIAGHETVDILSVEILNYESLLSCT